MNPILCGIETEYGLWIEGRGPGEQVEDATEFVRSCPIPSSVGWDYRFESPRADMRGFSVDRLAFDPEDSKYDVGKTLPPAHLIRADRVLPDGARFYNDHGHPEIATRESFCVHETAALDIAGERVVWETAQAYAAKTGRRVKVYKNNTDFHGASYGTHESYLVPRQLEFADLFHALLPMLVARQVLTGAGKVGREHGKPCEFQISQRADFFVEPANVETLFRRPIFNTRDEPHADPLTWRRLHVISGDANRMAACTRRKMFLVRLALGLAEVSAVPIWRLRDPVRAFESISKDADRIFDIDLENGTASAYGILGSYLDAGERHSLVPESDHFLLAECRQLLEWLRSDDARFARHVDWAAKQTLVAMYAEEEGLPLGDPSLQSVDLSYADLDPSESLFAALEEAGEVEFAEAVPTELKSRGWVRAIAVEKFREFIESISWRELRFKSDEGIKSFDLRPDMSYPATLADCTNVNEFISQLENHDQR